MLLVRSHVTALLAMLLLTGRLGLGAETATGPNAPRPPTSFAPSRSLLSQTQPGPLLAPPAAAPQVSFPSVEKLIGEMAAATPAGEESFYDPEYGIRGRLPAGWKIKGLARWVKNELLFVFEIPGHAQAKPTLTYRKFPTRQTIDDSQLAEWLHQAAITKSNQRLREGYAQYRMHRGTMHTVGGRPALTWLADYRVLAPSPLAGTGPLFTREHWIELLTQIHTLDGAVLLSLCALDRDMATLAAQFESLVQSVTLP